MPVRTNYLLPFSLCLLAALAGTGARAADMRAARTPVLLELFTSEGCSSCPPADTLLRELDQTQPAPSAELIVLSEHVDYWNRLGWTDPYSSAAFSKRQQAYAERFGSEDVYTPQLIIDGAKVAPPANRAAVLNAIEQEVSSPKIPIQVTASGGEMVNRFHIGIAPSSVRFKTATLYMDIALRKAQSHVADGENAGRVLEHTSVAGPLEKIAHLRSGQSFEKEIKVDASSGPEKRVILFLQDDSTGHILGVAELPASKF